MEYFREIDRQATRWKNGGGVTREVVAFPPGASIDDFGWRVSIADVETAGPFSCFSGVDRVLAVLHGMLRLTEADGPSVELRAEDPPHAFPGDAAVVGAPIGGDVRDLNVMVRRGQWRAVIWRCEAAQPIEVSIMADVAILIAAEPGVVAMVDRPAIKLDALDAVRLPTVRREMRLESGLLYLIMLFRV